jgi:hypothetical protein
MFKLGLAMGVLVSFGCAQKKNESAEKTLYSTSFAMSGSTAATSIVKNYENPFQKLMSMILPSAIAGIPTSMTDSQSVGVTLTSAWIVVKEIQFKAAETANEETEDEATEEVEFNGPYFVNLASATAQVLDTKYIPSKVYKRIEMKLEAAESDSSPNWPVGTPVGLSNKSMLIEGTYNGVNFSFSSHDGTEFKVSGAGGISPEEGQNLLMSIKFSDIIKKINLSALASSTDKNISEENRIIFTDACPLIESGINDIYTCFRKGLESEADFGKDSDGSGELESDEDNCDN